jgi:hypothetical protein
MSMTFLSFEIPSYSVVKSLSFNNFYSLDLSMLVSLESCILSIFMYAYLHTPVSIQDISVNMSLTIPIS